VGDVREVRDVVRPSIAVALNVAHTFASPGSVQLLCVTGTGVTVTANNIVLTAIQVGSLAGNQQIAG
jgi:hypothetical protein